MMLESTSTRLTLRNFDSVWRSNWSTALMDPETNVTEDDLAVTAKIAWAHLKELPDYYTRLAKMEATHAS